MAAGPALRLALQDLSTLVRTDSNTPAAHRELGSVPLQIARYPLTFFGRRPPKGRLTDHGLERRIQSAQPAASRPLDGARPGRERSTTEEP